MTINKIFDNTDKTIRNKIFDNINKIINNNDIVVFLKGTKDLPQCGFSNLVIKILQTIKVDFLDVDVLSNSDMRQYIKEFSDWPTIPQIYIKGEFIGGSDILHELYETKQLAQILDSKQISYQI